MSPEMTIRFNDLDSGLCETQLNLLAHAQCIELDIGSRCGGHGICGGDRIRIPADSADAFSPITEKERQHLTAEELNAGWRLGCQCWPNRRDLDVYINCAKTNTTIYI